MEDEDQRGEAPAADSLPAPFTMEELVEEQERDDFCQTVLGRQHRKYDSNFVEDHNGLLNVGTLTNGKMSRSLYLNRYVPFYFH